MSNQNYIIDMLELKDSNVFFKDNCYYKDVIKRIAFGFRSFRRFKARIMICKGLLKIKKKQSMHNALTVRKIITCMCLHTLFDNYPYF